MKPVVKTVVARMVGGIGNQLFIYAAAKRLAKKNGAKLVMDVYSGFAYDVNYRQKYQLDKFNIEPSVLLAGKNSKYVLSRPFRFLLRTVNKILPFEKRTYISQEGRDFDKRVLNIRIRNVLYLEGYWQSESYFSDIQNLIWSEFRIHEPADDLNRQLSKKIKESNSVAVHLRFFDIKDKMLVAENDERGNFFYKYYTTAIDKVKASVNNPFFYVFSDKPVLAKKFVAQLGIEHTLVDHNVGHDNASADLWLMSLCKHFIIANSIFSWWGAWLCQDKKKIVIAPGSFNGQALEAWGFEGLIPDNWIVLNL